MGLAEGFPCKDVALLSLISASDLVNGPCDFCLNDVWGWVDPVSGREFALSGTEAHVSFVEVTDPVNPVIVGKLRSHDPAAVTWWRDLKVYNDHMYVVVDNRGSNGIQVFDLKNLLSPPSIPYEFEQTAHYDGLGHAHNVVVNEATGFLFATGSRGGTGNTCPAGLHMIDINNPTSPTYAGCFIDSMTGYNAPGYVHDAQCVIYNGPDADYTGREVCFMANETAISLADVTDKSAPVKIAHASYPDVNYAHQGWLTEDHRYFIQNDELDEVYVYGQRTRTLIWDVNDLDDPVLNGEYRGETEATDHNLYVVGDYVYMANYTNGMRIVDIHDISSPREIAYFDTYPPNDDTGFNGAWTAYPYLPSGTILVNSSPVGLFMLRHSQYRLGLPKDQEYVVGNAVLDWVLPEAVNGEAPYMYTLSPALPAGLVFDPLSRTLSGTPALGIPATTYWYRVTDASGLTVSRAFDIEVRLAMAPIEDQRYLVGQAIPALELPAVFGGTDPHTYTLTPDLPAGLVFDAFSRTLSGTPTARMLLTTYTYTATDAAGATASQLFSLEALAVRLPRVADQTYVVGVAIPDWVLPGAEGGTAPLRYWLFPDLLPPGLVFEASSHTLSGTPTAVKARATYAYTVTDGTGATDSEEFFMEVVAAVLALPPVADQTFVVREAIVGLVMPAAEGGTAPFTYTLDPAPPPGLVFDASSRTLSGTATEILAPTTYTYTVTDAADDVAAWSFRIEVKQALALPSVADQAYVAHEVIPDLVLPAAVGGMGPPYTYSLSPAPPAGLAFDASVRTLSGTPTEDSALADYTYMVADTLGASVSQMFRIEVLQVLSLPPVADQVYVVGETTTPLELPAALGGQGPYGYALSPDPPPGLVFDTLSRTLSGTPTEVAALVAYMHTVTDVAGRTASMAFSIEVLAALALPSVADQVYAVGEEVSPFVLPAAMGGRDPYAYTLSPDPPAGLVYDVESRTLSGTPTEVMALTAYTYTVTDAAQTAETQTFNIVVGASATLIRDRAVLISLYDATDGANWTDNDNWLHPPVDVFTFTEQELNAWHGVTVSDGCVVGLDLSQNNLRGALPEALGDLSCMEQLRLQGNSLMDTIPSSLGRLDSLRGLLLHDNKLIGAIPTTLGKLVSLEQLRLHNNDLDGDIPKALGDLSALAQLWLYGNSLEGAIPSSLGLLKSLRGLLLHDNQLTGTIPSSLGDLARLEDLWLHSNSLNGTIPPSLGRLDSLRGLLLNDNSLVGAIPSSLGNLSHLEQLQLQGNRLDSGVPPSLGQLDSLRLLLLRDNALEGAIPSTFGRLAQLERLELNGNMLTGSIPDSMGQLDSLVYLHVQDNELAGELPVSFVQLAALRELFFDGPNQLVCAPQDAAFRAWLGSLDAVRGPDCGGSVLEFGLPVSDQRYIVGKRIVDLALPAAGGGRPPYHYTLHPAPPAGLVFDAARRILHGTPVDTVSYAAYAYTAVDGLGSTGQLHFTITVVTDNAELLELHGNYPNPFRKVTHLELSLAHDARVTVQVFDLLGRRVLEQKARTVQAGQRRHLAIDELTVGPGIYLYKIVAIMDKQTLVRTGRMILVR